MVDRDRNLDRAGMTFIPAGTRTGTGIEMKTRPGPGLASSRPGPGFFQYFSISVKMKQCYMLNKIFQNKLRYVKLKLTVSSSNYSISISLYLYRKVSSHILSPHFIIVFKRTFQTLPSYYNMCSSLATRARLRRALYIEQSLTSYTQPYSYLYNFQVAFTMLALPLSLLSIFTFDTVILLLFVFIWCRTIWFWYAFNLFNSEAVSAWNFLCYSSAQNIHC